MRKIIILLLLSLVLSSYVASANYVIMVSYPKSVYWGRSFTITFSLSSTVINSTNFQYVTPGTKTIKIGNYTAYQGFGEYWIIDKINITNASMLIVSFEGKVVGNFTWNPGIALYGYNFSLTSRDGQTGNYEIVVAWSGTLWLDKLNGWEIPPPLNTLPKFTSGNYTVVFTRSENSSVCVYSIIINGSTYLVKYNTGVPWDSIGYVGIRTDTDTVLPLNFYVIASIPAHYIVYVNGKEYASGFGSLENVSLKLYSSAVINITYPAYNVYKVITVSPSDKANVKMQFPIIQVTLIVITGFLIGVSTWREIIKRNRK